MDEVKIHRESVLSLAIYLYAHSVKLMKKRLMAKISITLKYCNIGKYTRVYLKHYYWNPYLVFSGNKFRFICFINEKPNSI